MEDQRDKKKFWQSKWVKGMGIGAFTFFLIKGLIWLAVIFGVLKATGC